MTGAMGGEPLKLLKEEYKEDKKISETVLSVEQHSTQKWEIQHSRCGVLVNTLRIISSQCLNVTPLKD